MGDHELRGSGNRPRAIRPLREPADTNSTEAMNGIRRADIRPGIEVEVVMKEDQRTGRLTRGVVRQILTNSPSHPHGIKVRLESGQVGRVQRIIT